MKIIPVLAVLLLAVPAFAAPKPIDDNPVGTKAFVDLGAYYDEPSNKPPYQHALSDLAAGGDAAQLAGQYLLALFQQAMADETNGRAVWKRQPFWGGGSQSPARDFRKELAAAFADAAQGDGALPAAMWLINEEKLPEGEADGIKALRRIKSPDADDALGTIIAQPHPNEEILTGALAEVGQRKLAAILPRVIILEDSHRAAVRKAAADTAALLGDKTVRPFQPELAFTPALCALVEKIADRVYTPVPPDAKWVKLTFTNPRPGRPPMIDYGWLLPDNGDNTVILDWQGQEVSLPKKQTTIAPSTLSDAAQIVEKVRKANTREELETLSLEGGLTAQFEPGFITMPEALVAAWSFARGDKTTAAAILFPCFDQTKDDRWIDWAARDMLGNRYHQRMLDKFSLERDYPATLQLAQHLSKPLFDGFNYQSRAKELAAQLPARMDDFKTFTLPTPDAWAKQKATMSRADQVAFLAAHLRLLNCIQMMQPGGVSYEDPQYAGSFESMKDRGPSPQDVLINPYNELKNMDLTPADIEALLPFATDNTYMPTYSYWRNFHPGRTLHRVSWAVEDLVNEAAQQTLVDLKELDALDDDGKKQALDKIKAWCTAHEGKSAADLLAETIRTTKNQSDFLKAATKALTLKQPDLITLAVSRAGDFPQATASIAELCVLSGQSGFAEQARQWLKATPPANTQGSLMGQMMQQMGNGQGGDDLRFWSSLILVRDGDRAKDEGLDVLRSYLDKDDGTYYYPRAVPALLATKDDKLIALACGVLKKPGILTSPRDGADQIRRLFLAGRPECRDFLLAELKDTSPGTETEFMTGPDGNMAQIHPPASEYIVIMISEWRKDGFRYDQGMSPADHRKKRAELAEWISTQFALIQQGKAPDMRTDLSNNVPQWQLDSP